MGETKTYYTEEIQTFIEEFIPFIKTLLPIEVSQDEYDNSFNEIFVKYRMNEDIHPDCLRVMLNFYWIGVHLINVPPQCRDERYIRYWFEHDTVLLLELNCFIEEVFY